VFAFHGTLSGDQLLKVEPVQILHYKVGVAAQGEAVDSSDDVLMLQSAVGRHLSLKTTAGLAVHAEKSFDGNNPIDADLSGLVDPGHAATADQLENSILAIEGLTDQIIVAVDGLPHCPVIIGSIHSA